VSATGRHQILAGPRVAGSVPLVRSGSIQVTLYSDAACPWAYSAAPALRVLEWRYGSQLEWRLVLIGLTERAEQYVERGYTPLKSARGYASRFRRYGMPFAPEPRARMIGTGRACRAVVAARLGAPGSEWEVFRALQFAWFTTTLLLDEDAAIREAIAAVPGIDPDAIVGALDEPAVVEAYERDRAEARTAAGSPTEFQGKSAVTDGPVRYTAPSVIFEHGETRLEAGGFQPVEAYDVIVANLDPALHREQPPEAPGPLLDYFPFALTTQEVAACLAQGNDPPDRPAAESALLELVAAGRACRTALGDDALWSRL
jgi:2-hydroxychromene-2-carboxylate isomerase